MNFNIPYFICSLSIVAQGMLGVFLVTAVIIIVVLLLNKLTHSNPQK